MKDDEALTIPRIIHYCWFGGKPLPTQAVKCIESWKKNCPDFEIIEWNEENFDVSQNRYAQEAYQAKKYAFVSDYARFWILCNRGGVYMDTDVEVLKPIDKFLMHKGFAGFENDESVAPGLILGSIANFDLMKEILDSYKDRRFLKGDGTYDSTTVVRYMTDILLKHGLILNGMRQNIEGLEIYPKDYFCPLDYQSGKLEITENTHTIHYFAASWHSFNQKYKKILKKIIGKKMFKNLAKIKTYIKGGFLR